jgi:hypothetical protein
MVAITGMPAAFIRLANPVAIRCTFIDQLYAALSSTETVMSQL